jgi:hypothetical protein
MAGCDQLWLRLQWLGFDDWLRAANGFSFNGWIQCLATSWKLASASMADCGFNALTSMPGYKLQKGFDFKGWLRHQWLGFNAWLRAAKWLRLQWLALA